MKKRKDLNDVVSDSAHDATVTAKDLIAQATEYLNESVVPRVREVADDVVTYLEPRARDLGEKGAKFVAEGRDDLQPKIARFAADTRDKAQPYLDEAYHRVEPGVKKAKKRVEPLVDTGLDQFNANVRPLLDNVATKPQAVEARKRLAAASAALAGELSLPEPVKKRSKGQTLLMVLLASGLLGGVIFAVKRFLAPAENGWQAHEPSTAYTPRRTTLVDETVTIEDADDNAGVDAELVEAADEAAVVSEDVKVYGEGAYVGENPPEGFAIKGNERSMKYHVEGNGGYDRTIADVWFNSEEAAEAAGFTKAQR